MKANSTDKFIVWCFIGGASLQAASLIPGAGSHGISMADTVVACGAVFVVLEAFMRRRTIVVHRGTGYLAFLCLWSFAGYAYLVSCSPFEFSESEFAKSFAKLVFYGICFALFYSRIRKMDIRVVSDTVANILALHAIIAIYIYLVMTFNIPLPYRFFWFNQSEVYMPNSYYMSGWSGRGTGFVVARGLFSEPSFLGIYMNWGLAFLLLSPRSGVGLRDWRVVATAASMLLSFSMSAIFLLMVNVLLLMSFRPQSRRQVIPLFLAIALMAVPMRSFLQEAVIGRVAKMKQGTDNSTTARLVLSWLPTVRFVQESPVFGAGLGNYDVAVASIDIPKEYEFLLGTGKTFNVFAYVLGSMGFIGLLFFVAMVLQLVKRHPRLGLIFVMSLFARGDLLTSSVLVFFGLFLYSSLSFPGRAGNRWGRSVAASVRGFVPANAR